jgi:signal transduction histidine kinase
MRAKEFNRLLWTTLTIGACSVISLTTFVWFLSFWVVKPAKQGFEKQRRFIQEASHELRTPLTVISTGIDLLSKRNSELNGGENATANGGRKNGEKAEKNGKNNKIDKNNAENDTEKWLNNIKEQTVKMATMTNDLLTLSRLSETEKVTKAEFNISKTISGEITAFECVAFENGKQIIDDIDTGLYYNGNENAVRQAAAILLDNAIKHSAERSNIEVTLIKNKHITLTVANDSELNANELPFIFERFYRGSESRAKTIGTGLGLAILKNTAEKNGWQIDVKITGHNKLTLTIIF